MKIAVCLYGYFNNRADENAGVKGYSYLMSVLKPYIQDVDFFIHTWDSENYNKILELYKPKKSVCSEPKNFDIEFKKFGVDENKINEGFQRKGTIYEQCKLNATASFLLSRTASIAEKKIFEKENNFEYDVVLVCRFDIGQRSGYHKGYNVSLLPFDTTLDMNYIYSAMWAQLNAGYADQWFFSSSNNIDKLIKMYASMMIDFQSNSEYEKVLTTGWFDSRDFSTIPENQFSNEMLRKDKDPNVIQHKYPKWQMINNHIYHKWYFKKSGLYEKSKFI